MLTQDADATQRRPLAPRARADLAALGTAAGLTIVWYFLGVQLTAAAAVALADPSQFAGFYLLFVVALWRVAKSLVRLDRDGPLRGGSTPLGLVGMCAVVLGWCWLGPALLTDLAPLVTKTADSRSWALWATGLAILTAALILRLLLLGIRADRYLAVHRQGGSSSPPPPRSS